MASTAHPSFPPRPYANTLHGKLPEKGGGLGAGASSAPGFGATSRDNARQERERLERENRAGGGGASGAGPGGAGPPAAGFGTSGGGAHPVTDEQREEITEAFGLFDLDKDGKVDYHEFKVCLKALGFTLPKPQILSLLTAHGAPIDPHDPNPPRARLQPKSQTPPSLLFLDLHAFQEIAAKLIGERDPRDEILRAFALFDPEDKGMISLDDLRRVARELGEGLEEDELAAMIEEFDLEGKGGVSREEFVGICMG